LSPLAASNRLRTAIPEPKRVLQTLFSRGKALNPTVTPETLGSDQARDLDRAQTHLRILHAAIKLFGSMGYDNTTIRAVTSRAGTDSAAAHYHYSDKKHLYRRAIEACVARLLTKDLSSEDKGLVDRDDKAYLELSKILAWEILSPSGENITHTPLLNELCQKDVGLAGLKAVIENLVKTDEKP
jgi:AcrR family transcriptional regulator